MLCAVLAHLVHTQRCAHALHHCLFDAMPRMIGAKIEAKASPELARPLTQENAWNRDASCWATGVEPAWARLLWAERKR